MANQKQIKKQAGFTFLKECGKAFNFLMGIADSDEYEIDTRILAADAAEVCYAVIHDAPGLAFGKANRQKLRAKVVGIANEGMLPASENITYVKKHVCSRIRVQPGKASSVMKKAFKQAGHN